MNQPWVMDFKQLAGSIRAQVIKGYATTQLAFQVFHVKWCKW